MKLDVTEFVPFGCWRAWSFYRAAVAYDDQICELFKNSRKHNISYKIFNLSDIYYLKQELNDDECTENCRATVDLTVHVS